MNKSIKTFMLLDKFLSSIFTSLDVPLSSKKKEKKDEKLDMLPVSEYIDKGSKVLFPIICFTDRF